MAPCRLRKTRTVLLFAVAVLSLLIACNSADEKAGPAGTTPTPAAPPTSTPHPAVELTVGKTVYQVGERVHYTITNGAESSVWYLTGGCYIPHIVRFEDDREIELVTFILDVEIVPKELPAGETLSCEWNQRAWSGEGRDWGNHRVPPGRYQFRFRYAFEEDHAYSRIVSAVVKSPVFAIE